MAPKIKVVTGAIFHEFSRNMSHNLWMHFCYGAFHKLHRQDFTNFLPASPLPKQVHYISLCSNIGIWLTPPSPLPAYIVYGYPLWWKCYTYPRIDPIWVDSIIKKVHFKMIKIQQHWNSSPLCPQLFISTIVSWIF